MVQYACVNITSLCNMECPYCFRVGNTLQDMSIDKFRLYLEKLITYGCQTICITGGEPLLNKDWREFLKLSKEKGLKVILSTNGVLLNIDDDALKYIDVLSIPLDGGEEEINARTRGNNHFQLIYEIINKYKINKYNFCLKINTVITQFNLKSLNELAELLNDYRIIWKLFNVRKKGEFFYLSDEFIPKREDVYEQLNGLFNRNLLCKMMFLDNLEDNNYKESVSPDYIIVNSDGNIYLAGGNEDKLLGNISEINLNDIKGLDNARLNNQYWSMSDD